MARRRQHHKGKKRLGHWHQGRAQGHVNDRFLRSAERHFAIAAADAEAATDRATEFSAWLEHLESVASHVGPIAPFVPRFDFDIDW